MHISWKPLFVQYKFNLCELYNNSHKVYPPQELVFKVFEMDVKEIKIVLLGQDPYHKEGQSNGLSFSVTKDTKIPPSLRNIFKELKLEFPERNYEFKNGFYSTSSHAVSLNCRSLVDLYLIFVCLLLLIIS